MSPLCQCCGDTVGQLKQQVSVMRSEIKNLRQMLDSATRANRKHMLALQSALSKIGDGQRKDVQTPAPPSSSASDALEQGRIQTVPIGYITSCFSAKNGTPRQPTVCGPSRAKLRIQQSVFNNPAHALECLEQYSHVWVIFLFHKNGHLSYKAKVKPPRLNGQRVGVYSTRSPHRPNALGLTLAKLDGIVGDTVHLSDIDMIAGTPVLDIKPFISDYDSPKARTYMDLGDSDTDTSETVAVESNMSNICKDIDPHSISRDNKTCSDNGQCQLPQDGPEVESPPINPPDVSNFTEDVHRALQEVKDYMNQLEMQPSHSPVLDSSLSKAMELSADRPSFGEELYSTIASWIREPPVGRLEVRFTPQAERELAGFLPADQPGLQSVEDPVVMEQNEERQNQSDEPQPQPLPALLICDICGKMYKKNLLARHKRWHASKIKCSGCEKAFYHTTGLKRHMDFVHNKATLKCNDCGSSFKSKSGYEKHLSLHTNRTYKCKDCDRAFDCISKMYHHREQQHKAGTFVCSKCGKCFVSNSKLDRHMSTHNDSRPFCCTECPSTFKHKKDLNVHLQTHTIVTCDLCQKTYRGRRQLKRHKRTCH